MARARHLWAVAAALLGSFLPALAQSSWPVQVVDTAPSGVCATATYKGAVVQRDTALLYRCLDPDGDGIGLWSQIREVRYMDFDTDGDDVSDYRVVGDYDGDGTLEIQDLQSALDRLCDANADGTQDRTQTIDSDGDATVDDTVPYCGTLFILPGQFVGGTGSDGNATQLTVGWSGVTVEGSGRLATILRSGYAYAKLFSRTCGTGGTPCASPAFTQVVSVASGTNMMRRVTLKNFRIEGLSSKYRRDKCTTYSCVGGFDADADGTSDGAQHGVSINNPDDVIVEDVHVHNSDRIAFLWGTDTSVYQSQVGTLTFNRVRTDGSLGEHCMAGSPVYLQVMNSHLEGCDWTDIDAKAIEYIVYDGNNVGNYGMQITGNWIASGAHGIRVFPAAGLTGGPLAFNWKRFLISGNTFLNTGVSISLEASIGTAATGFSMGNIAITGNTFTKPLVYATPISGGFINIQEVGGYGTIKGVTISGNQFDQDSTASIGTGSSNAFQHVNVQGADSVSVSGNSFIVFGNNSSTPATEELAVSIYGGIGHSVTSNGITINGGGVEGIKLNGVDYSIVSGNSIAGVEYPAAVSGWGNKTGIDLLNSSNSLVMGNEIGRTKSGIYLWGSGGNTASNSIMMNRCRITGACVWIDGGGTNTNNTVSFNSASDCDPDGTGSVTTNTYAWLDVNAAGSNLWSENAAQACWADAAAGGASAYVAAGHGSTWVLDSDFDSVPDYDTATWLRYGSKSGVDLYWDSGIRFRNTAGTYFTTVKAYEPYSNGTISFSNSTGTVTLTPSGFPTSQCTEWNVDGYLVGSGAACGDIVSIGDCSGGTCFSETVNETGTAICYWDGASGASANKTCIDNGGSGQTADYAVGLPKTNGTLCASGDAGCGTYAKGLDSGQDATNNQVSINTTDAIVYTDANADGVQDYGVDYDTGRGVYFKYKGGGCVSGSTTNCSTGTAPKGIDWYCYDTGALYYCDGTSWQGVGALSSKSTGDVDLKPDEDADGTGTISVYGNFTNKDPANPTNFVFDANNDLSADVELEGDGTNSGVWVKQGAGYIKYGTASVDRIKACGSTIWHFWDEDGDGTDDGADDYSYGPGIDLDGDCTADLQTQVDIDGDGTREASLSSSVLSFDPDENGVADLVLDGNDKEIRWDLDNDGTLEFQFDNGDEQFCFDPDDNANCDVIFKDYGVHPEAKVGIAFHGASAPTIMHNDTQKALYFDYDEDGTYDMTLDGSAQQITMDADSDGVTDLLLNKTFIQTDQLRYSTDSAQRMTATNGRMHLCGGNQFAPNAAAGACMSLGGSTGTYATAIYFDPDGDGTNETNINSSGVYSGQATTAGALTTDPTGCTNQFVTDMAAAGALTCNSVTGAYVTDGSLLEADLTWNSTATRTAGQYITVASDTTKFDVVTPPAMTLYQALGTTIAGNDPFLFKAPYAMTISQISCIVWAATSITLSVEECDSAGANCAGVDGATTITCDTNSQDDDGSLSNPSIDSGDWIKLNFGSATGTINGVSVTVKYTTP